MAERLPQGIRKHIRYELSKARKSKDPVKIKKAEQEAEAIRTPRPDRLDEINKLLANNDLPLAQRVELEIERAWIRSARQEVTPDERRDQIDEALDRLEVEAPQEYERLTRPIKYDEKGRPVTAIAEIRDRALISEGFRP